MKKEEKNKPIAAESDAKTSEMAKDSNMPPAGDDKVSEEMSAEETAMFNQIMGEIEGEEKPRDQVDTAERATTPQSASLPQDDPQDDGLDEDQQKAFESIMAQIEGGAQSDDGVAAGDKADETVMAGDEDEDDFAAELEKVAREADAASNQNEDAGDGDDELDEDQQKALASIMAEIEGNGAQEDAADADTTLSTDAGAKEASPQKADPAENKGEADADTDDASDDIEDILKEITSDLDDSETEAGDAKSETAEVEIAKADDDIIVNDKSADNAPPKSLPQEDKAAEKTPAADATSTKKEAPKSKPAINQGDATEDPVVETATPLRNVKRSNRLIGGRAAMFGSALLVFSLSLAGYYSWTHSRTNRPAPPLTVAEKPVVQKPVAAVDAPPPAPMPEDSSDQDRLRTIGDRIDQLRRESIAKRQEIEDLRDYYRSGIDTEIQNLAKMLRETVGGRITLNTALADPLVSMGIKAIQRREAYIKKLEDPAKALHINSEELLYLSRKAGVLAMMASKTSDIDIDGFIEHADAIMADHRKALARLNIDDVDVPDTTLDSIWQRIESRLLMAAKASIPTQSGRTTQNEAIWGAVCRGDFTQKHKMTALSPEAARCLAGWKGKDLFLNQLTTLTPEAARHLADWKGEWIGLNGLADLSPEAATYLAQWKGKGLSLNGLTRLSPRLVAILSEWQGDQIELINVKYMAHWENPKTRLFLSEAMDRRINEKRQ